MAASPVDVGDIILEMANVQELLYTNLAEAAKSNMLSALATKIRRVEYCDSRTALRLVQAIDACTMPEERKAVLQSAVDARLAAGAQSDAAIAKTPQQELTSICNYLTQQDWNKVLSPMAQPAAIMTVLISRHAQLGIRHLHGQTVKAAITVLLHALQ